MSLRPGKTSAGWNGRGLSTAKSAAVPAPGNARTSGPPNRSWTTAGRSPKPGSWGSWMTVTDQATSKARVGSICTGCAGIELGLDRVLDVELAWVCEHEPPTERTPNPAQAGARLIGCRRDTAQRLPITPLPRLRMDLRRLLRSISGAPVRLFTPPVPGTAGVGRDRANLHRLPRPRPVTLRHHRAGCAVAMNSWRRAAGIELREQQCADAVKWRLSQTVIPFEVTS